MTTEAPPVPKAFVWRRLHSFTGIMLAIYLLEHLGTNSQAALWLGDDGIEFIRLVNVIHGIPYLQVVEWLLIGIPFLIHGVLGVRIALQGRSNSRKSDGSRPALPQYSRNRAYTWQRISAWILLFGVVAHVIHMRIIRQPKTIVAGREQTYVVKLDNDPGLPLVAGRLQVALYDSSQIQKEQQLLQARQRAANIAALAIQKQPLDSPAAEEIITPLRVEQQQVQLFSSFVNTLLSYNLGPSQLLGVTSDYGAAMLLMVRNAMSIPWICILYTVFVLSASFHAYNGVWTAMVSWGIVMSQRSQRRAALFCSFLVWLFSFLGLAAVWGTYWINLRT